MDLIKIYECLLWGDIKESVFKYDIGGSEIKFSREREMI
jgi:hypothetical protein